MRLRNLYFALFLIAALGALPISHAGEKTRPSAKKKSSMAVKDRILSELIETTLKEGRSMSLGKDTSESLGLGSARTRVKAIQYTSKTSPDKQVHSMKVVYRRKKSGDLEPTSIIWQTTKYRKTKKGKHVNGRAYRFLPSGRLINAVTVKGIAKKTKHTVLSVNSRRAKRGFKKEMKYWLKDTAGLVYLK